MVADITKRSNALDLKPGIFAMSEPRKIARSLKRSAEASTRRKADPYRSALSMLTFYINRADSKLGSRRRHVLERAKIELRKQFKRAPAKESQ
jgi:Protein of unknown function (DUF3175)